MKSCPVCKREHGSRKLKCDCGFDFKKKKQDVKQQLVPEPGMWVIDESHGMPKIHRPEPYEDGPISNEVIREQVEYEGLGYCIYSWIPADRIKDKKLAKLFKEARSKMQAIAEHLDL